MTLVEAAQSIALAHAVPCGTEIVALVDAAHRILAETIVAQGDLPATDVSIMDGYACTLAAVHAGRVRVVGESAAGHPWAGRVVDDGVIRISTGAVVPAGTELVVAQEDTHREGEDLVFDAAFIPTARAGRHIRSAGSDVQRGTELATPGLALGAAELALIGAGGAPHVTVFRRPRVAILSTGDELVGLGETPSPGQVVSTNALQIAIACADAGAEVVAQAIVGDDAGASIAAIDHAIAVADVVVTTGGASVGDHDHVRAAANRDGFEVLVWGVALRPGKPTGIVRTPAGLWFALPGNPASTFVTFELFVRPVLRKMLGVRGDPRRPLRRMIAGGEMRGETTREHWIRARTEGERVVPLPDQLSGNLRSLATADALVRVPIGTTRIEPGAGCDVLVFDTNAHERGP